MLDPDWFRMIQAGSYVSTALAAISAATAAIIAARKYNLDRDAARHLEQQEGDRRRAEIDARQEANRIAARDLSWRRMDAAQKMLDAMSADDGYAVAATMLDWTCRDYEISDVKHFINQGEMLHALRTVHHDFDDREVFIRDSFDQFFYFMERVQHQIAIGMVDIAHVVVPLRYYACRVNENRSIFDNYLDEYTFTGSKTLIDNLLEQPGPVPKLHPPYSRGCEIEGG